MLEADRSAFQARENGGHQAIPQREADLVPLWAAVTRATNASARQQAYSALSSKLDERSSLDAGIRAAVQDVLSQPEVAATVQVDLSSAISEAERPQLTVERLRKASLKHPRVAHVHQHLSGPSMGMLTGNSSVGSCRLEFSSC